MAIESWKSGALAPRWVAIGRWALAPVAPLGLKADVRWHRERSPERAALPLADRWKWAAPASRTTKQCELAT